MNKKVGGGGKHCDDLGLMFTQSGFYPVIGRGGAFHPGFFLKSF